MPKGPHVTEASSTFISEIYNILNRQGKRCSMVIRHFNRGGWGAWFGNQLPHPVITVCRSSNKQINHLQQWSSGSGGFWIPSTRLLCWLHVAGKYIWSAPGDYKCQPALIVYWHAQLEFTARANTMLAAANGPPGAEQNGDAAGAVSYLETCRFAEREAALAIILMGPLAIHQHGK